MENLRPEKLILAAFRRIPVGGLHAAAVRSCCVGVFLAGSFLVSRLLRYVGPKHDKSSWSDSVVGIRVRRVGGANDFVDGGVRLVMQVALVP